MKTRNVLKMITFGLTLAAVSMMLTRCTKKGENIAQLEKDLQSIAAGDSVVFAQFYDSTIVKYPNAPVGVNDVIRSKGILSIIQGKCGMTSCHPNYNSYNTIKSLVNAGSPEGSKLWQVIASNDHNEVMPPVYSQQLSATEKVKIYNWIKNGASERPQKQDLHAPVLHMITSGCASVNCHNAQTLVGDWARRGWVPATTSDTTMVTLTSTAGVMSYLATMSEVKTAQMWGAYKDSVRKYYADPVANASFKPFKTVTRRSPFNNYDDVLLDIWYPKGARAKANYLDNNDAFMRRIDSTIIYTNQVSGVAATPSGNMTWDDAHWFPEEIAMFKEWYFLNGDIPDSWKFGTNGQGIFKYEPPSTKVITK